MSTSSTPSGKPIRWGKLRVSLRFLLGTVAVVAIASWALRGYLESKRCYLIIDCDVANTLVVLNDRMIGRVPVRIEMSSQTRQAIANGGPFGSLLTRPLDSRDTCVAFLPNRGEKLVFQFAEASSVVEVGPSGKVTKFTPLRFGDVWSNSISTMVLRIKVLSEKDSDKGANGG